MRYLILLFFFFGFAVANAQTTESQTVTAKKELSDADFIRAKKMYLDMMQTEGYKKSKEASHKFRKGLGNVEFPSQEQMWEWEKNLESLKIWAQENYANSNFGSAKELEESYTESKNLGVKYIHENREIYLLMGRANLEQFREILEPEREMMFKERMNKQ